MRGEGWVEKEGRSASESERGERERECGGEMYLLPLHLLPIFLYPHPLIPQVERFCLSDPKISFQFLFSSKFQAVGEREEERRESASKAHPVLPVELEF